MRTFASWHILERQRFTRHPQPPARRLAAFSTQFPARRLTKIFTYVATTTNVSNELFFDLLHITFGAITFQTYPPASASTFKLCEEATVWSLEARKYCSFQYHSELWFLRNATYFYEYGYDNGLTTSLDVMSASQRLSVFAWYPTKYTLLATFLSKTSEILFSSIVLARAFLRCIYKTNYGSPSTAILTYQDISCFLVSARFYVVQVSNLKLRRGRGRGRTPNLLKRYVAQWVLCNPYI